MRSPSTSTNTCPRPREDSIFPIVRVPKRPGNGLRWSQMRRSNSECEPIYGHSGTESVHRDWTNRQYPYLSLGIPEAEPLYWGQPESPSLQTAIKRLLLVSHWRISAVIVFCRSSTQAAFGRISSPNPLCALLMWQRAADTYWVEANQQPNTMTPTGPLEAWTLAQKTPRWPYHQRQKTSGHLLVLFIVIAWPCMPPAAKRRLCLSSA